MKYVEDTSGVRVLAAMSGGVDSSVMACLLQRAGFDVRGITMSLLPHGEGGSGDDAVRAAKETCDQLGLPHAARDLSELFQARVIDGFCDAYLNGSTPNPCVECNRYLKFGELHRIRQREGAHYLATGHYVRRRFDEETGRWQLLRGSDPNKDQSYFLFHLSQDAIAHTLFPLGEMEKHQVRAIARECELGMADAPESQDVCFVPGGDHVAFIEGHSGRTTAFDAGPITDEQGNVLGTHQGLVRYTIGQRKGIGVAASEPLYVVGKSLRDNTLIVATKDDAMVRHMRVRIGGPAQAEPAVLPGRVHVKAHYRQTPRPATIERVRDGYAEVTFDAPQMPTAPGQFAVFYDEDAVVGGGRIAATEP